MRIFWFVAVCILLESRIAIANLPFVSGIYPHLAFYNSEGECGTGAVVPWADRLWVITYGPHKPVGSTDKLYEITPDLKLIVRQESIGGTPANRMIHSESKQLFIGPYVIDANRNVRTIPYPTMQGRHTGNARHLTDPQNKIYYATMEEGFYEVDVKDLTVNTLYADANNKRGGRLPEQGNGAAFASLLGAHGKGLYSGQGVLVFSNNGENNHLSTKQFDIESGALYEWNGKEWHLIRRNQFVEVTGPGGIYGNPNPQTDPIWATGWDHKSTFVGVREPQKGWAFYRLPKASNTYDGAHGWNTEWPRIRNIGRGNESDYLMTMHGMFWSFPSTFTIANSKGIKPRSAYLKVIGDFARWNDRLVFGCDDSAQKEFLNKRKLKGDIEGVGQSNSNLWFTTPGLMDSLGTTFASGAVWLNEPVAKNVPSEPMLFEGWPLRTAWVKNAGEESVLLTLEVDRQGNGQWTPLRKLTVAKGSSFGVPFESREKGVWIRASVDKPSIMSLSFVYNEQDLRISKSDKIFNGLAPITGRRGVDGLLWGLGDDSRRLGVLASFHDELLRKEIGYYELDETLRLIRKEASATADHIRERFAIPKNSVEVGKGSVLVVDDKGRRWRLPLGGSEYADLTVLGSLRLCREVVTERDLFSCCGTFYELPAENADGFAKIRPISSHSFRIHDYASYRGLLVMTGVDPELAKTNPRIIVSDDRKASVWVGAIDDLWKLGKPQGKGGPWIDEPVKANVPSDPYLISHYDNRSLELSVDGTAQTITVSIEVDPIGNGDWVTYKTLSVKRGKRVNMLLPKVLLARWIRFTVDKDCLATAWLNYN